MKELEFEWDDNKALKNKKKHEGITFEEAKTVFEDERAILFDDPDHSIDEQRFIIIGMSYKSRMLVVCHCYREEGNTIRIISARRATKSETRQYIELNESW